ncbi:hypothetical protein NS506_04361 [Nocardia seriolae]|uniref:Uncharacterized protein n=1 Tax=Nocardia seriolae TaxID=37332 RepID=A0ABC8AW74_9NOCA|nr:hypothetical protein NS506_04361 [Nocardia seriolae]
MYGIAIENHEALTVMPPGFAREVLRVHARCPISVCARKRQAVAVVNAAARKAGSSA